MIMKIAFVVQRYGENINGGAEQHCRQLAEKMSEKHHVEVLTTTAEDYYTWENRYPPGTEVLNGVTVRRFNSICRRGEFEHELYKSRKEGNFGYFDDFNWMMQQGPVSPDLVNYISYHRDCYDVFVFFTYLYYTTYAGLQAVPEKSVLIPTAHDEEAIYRPIFRGVFALPRAIFFNTPEEADFVHGLFGASVPFDIGGIGFDGLPSGDAEDFRKKYGINGKFLLYAGRITERKGCMELFDYFSRLNSDYKLVLVGKEDILVPKANNIYSLGFVSDEDKFGALSACDALVIPSRFESFSMVLAEAMINKKPVIACGECEVLKGHCRRSNGGIYYSGYDEFCACVEYIENNENRIALGENGYKYISENYRWDIIVSKLENLINRNVLKNLKG